MKEIYSTKTCTKCGIKKFLSEFYKDKKTKDGHRSNCKKCQKTYAKNRYKQITEKIIENVKIYYQYHKKQILAKNKEYRQKNKNRIRINNKLYYEQNKQKLNEYCRNYGKDYYKQNKEKIIRKSINNHKLRRNKNIKYKIKDALRNRLTYALNGKVKSLATMCLIGCDIDYLMYHLQCQFKNKMTWDNYGFGKGKWVIDHIKPCCFFDLSKPEEQQKCFHYSNLQPLWWNENLTKGKKIC